MSEDSNAICYANSDAPTNSIFTMLEHYFHPQSQERPERPISTPRAKRDLRILTTFQKDIPHMGSTVYKTAKTPKRTTTTTKATYSPTGTLATTAEGLNLKKNPVLLDSELREFAIL